MYPNVQEVQDTQVLKLENAKLKKKLQLYLYLAYKAAKEKGNILSEMMIRDEAKEFGINLD